MSGRREEEEVEETVVEFMSPEHGEEDGEMGEEASKMEMGEEHEKSTEYTNLPKPEEPEPQWESHTTEQLRDWLRAHNVKGTWKRNLLVKCKDVWDDMQALLRDRGVGGQTSSSGVGDDTGTEEPNFSSWPLERKRTYLRRRDVKGIWTKYVDAKCAEIWHLEKAGEKYIHTPPSLGRTKMRFPGQAVLSVSPGNNAVHSSSSEMTPMVISSHDFHELASAAHVSDLKRVTDLLNNWSKKNQLPEEPHHPSVAELPLAVSTMLPSPEGNELHWVSTEVEEGGVRLPKAKRTSTGGTPSAKRKKTANGSAQSVAEEDPSVLQEQIQLLQNRLREVEAENQQLRSKTHRK